MRSREIIAQLPELTGHLATASGIPLEDAKRIRGAYWAGEEPEDPLKAEVFQLRKAGERDRSDHNVAPESTNDNTRLRLGALGRLEPMRDNLTRVDRWDVAGQIRNLTATVIFDAAAQPVSQAQRTAMTELIAVVPWYRRRSAKRAVAKAQVAAEAA